MEAKFSPGDKVRIINYGHPIWVSKNSEFKPGWPIISEDENIIHYDSLPEIVGKEGVISKTTITQERPYYAIEGISEKHAWYNEDQLELIEK